MTDFENIKLGVVCPMANEEKTALEFVEKVIKNCNTHNFKSVNLFTVFDNSCKDQTYYLLKNAEREIPHLNLIFESESKCVADAYIVGYKQALKAGCDWILEIDAGFSHQPSQIPQFLDKISEGYDCVFGSRFISGGEFKDAPLRRYVISRGGTVLANILLGTKLKDMTSGFEIFTAEVMQKILDLGIRSKGHFFQTEIKARCAKLNIAEIPIKYSSPSQTVTTNVLKDAFLNLFHLFTQRINGKLYIKKI
jgi:dolichol-phosphate mannosyltransferase